MLRAIVREVAAGGQRDELDGAIALLGDAALTAQTDAVDSRGEARS